jgi:hypothetical protein
MRCQQPLCTWRGRVCGCECQGRGVARSRAARSQRVTGGGERGGGRQRSAVVTTATRYGPASNGRGSDGRGRRGSAGARRREGRRGVGPGRKAKQRARHASAAAVDPALGARTAAAAEEGCAREQGRGGFARFLALANLTPTKRAGSREQKENNTTGTED